MLFTVVAYSLTCVRQKFYNIFIWLNYVVLKPTLTLNIVFLGIIWPDLIFIFLIIAFFYCDIAERVSYSQIVKYLLKSL